MNDSRELETERVRTAELSHDQFVANMRTLGADVEAWVQWVNARIEEGGMRQASRASALASIVTGRRHPDDPQPEIRGVSVGYTYADEREDWADASEAWRWAWMVERGNPHGPRVLLSDEDVVNLRLAAWCRSERDRPDPLTQPLRRGYPRTRGHDHG